MIELFYTTIKNLTSQGTLANWQQKKAALYRKKDDYLRSVASSLLINTVLFDRLPAPAPSFGNNGKPFFEGAPEFNVSHAGDFVVLAVSTLPVGIDIEQKVDADYLSLGKVFLCEYEYKLLKESADPCSLFYKLWTHKESYLKMTGMGLSQDPKNFSVLHDPPACKFYIRELSSDYAAAVCSADTVCAKDFALLTF